jgi:hypothetical protein
MTANKKPLVGRGYFLTNIASPFFHAVMAALAFSKPSRLAAASNASRRLVWRAARVVSLHLGLCLRGLGMCVKEKAGGLRGLIEPSVNVLLVVWQWAVSLGVKALNRVFLVHRVNEIPQKRFGLIGIMNLSRYPAVLAACRFVGFSLFVFVISLIHETSIENLAASVCQKIRCFIHCFISLLNMPRYYHTLGNVSRVNKKLVCRSFA